jgi:UDP-glucuronate 4-epimerase
MSILLTGAAGFIGFHVARKLLDRGETVIGVDNLVPYYDVALKEARLARLRAYSGFLFEKIDVADRVSLFCLIESYSSLRSVIHLGAQAGVRHSLQDPYSYIDANVMGTLVVLEAARRIKHLRGAIYASSSSVYGANRKQPFSIDDPVDNPVSLYGASKRSCELIAQTYSRLYGLPLTGLRFFTVYGPWGRPDMAYYLFTRAMLANEPIKLYNNGNMARDFTYIDDIVHGIVSALDRPAEAGEHRLYNFGNSRPERLLDFIAVLERAVGRTAIKELLPMQPGDVQTTYAEIDKTRLDLDFRPNTTIETGLFRFVEWYREYHRVS